MKPESPQRLEKAKMLGIDNVFPKFCKTELLAIFFRTGPEGVFLEPCNIEPTNWSSLAHKYVATKEYSNCHIFGPLAFKKIKSLLLL